MSRQLCGIVSCFINFLNASSSHQRCAQPSNRYKSEADVPALYSSILRAIRKGCIDIGCGSGSSVSIIDSSSRG
uniref:Putative secreted protein n=1 Tax=Anopheles marajoara TaxID=58244 RepID=A0A2M4CDA4_9DIPT